MNQILVTENKKKDKMKTSRPLEIKGIVKFFAIAIMVFGIVFIGEASYAIYQDIDDKRPENIPIVTIGRINDKAILYVEHNTEISKITYSWDNGEENVIPIGETTAQEEITLLGYNSTLYLTIEDINGKQISYAKNYILDGQDITKPTIDIDAQDGNSKMKIIAKDETAISYLSYQWEGEEPVRVDYSEEGQVEIKAEIPLTAGTKKIHVVAEDMNGNIEKIEKEVVISTSKPKVYIVHTDKKDKIKIEAQDKDGIKDIIVNLNGKKFAAKNVNKKEVKAGPLTLREGNNTISVKVTNVSGYTKVYSTEIKYEKP